MKKYSKLMVILLVVAMLLPGIVQAVPVAQDANIKRLAGENRVETSVAVSKEVYKEGADAVVLAGYSGEVDALSGTLLANAKCGPLLFTNKNKLAEDAKNEIKKLGAKDVYVLGGEKVVYPEVLAELKALGYTVKRISGDRREETAVAVAEEVGGATTHVFLAKGYGDLRSVLADALAVGPVSAKKDMPVLLTQTDKVPAATLEALADLGVKNITIVGGEGAVSAKVKTQLEKLNYKVDRLSGDNREGTAVAIANKFFKGLDKAIVANGYGSPDALVGGYLGAKMDAPILFSNNNRINTVSTDYIVDNTEFAYVLGGTGVINNDVFTKVQRAVKGEEEVEVKGELEVHFIDVGQGDSVLIKNGDSSMLIDAGNNGYGKTVVNYLKQNGIKKLDYVIGTHPHADHIGGLDDVINSFDIGKVIMPKVTHTSKTFEDVITAITNKGLKITTPKVGDKYSLGDASFTILAPNSDKYSNLNNYSVATRLEFGSNSFMFTGDAEAMVENEIINTGLNLKADVLKVGHHGSDTSTTEAFLNKVDPKYAVIQVGANNAYKHPDSIVINRLKERNITTYRNDLNGNILAISDGQTIKFTTDTSKPEVPEIDDEDDNQDNDQNIQVIRTKTGTKYHIAGCRTLKSEIPLTLKEAKERGLEPCKVCNPPR